MKLLVWNLYHGRAHPPAGRPLAVEFTRALVGWNWDVACLQEVPPWWAGPLARACGAQGLRALTSRNIGLSARRAVAARNPDLIGSWGGGSNVLLVRGGGATAHASALLSWRPERRRVHAVRTREGVWVGNLHASLAPKSRAKVDVERAARWLARRAAAEPCVLAGDFNLEHPPALAGYTATAGPFVDHVLARGVAVREVTVLEKDRLSDHPALGIHIT